MSLRPKIAVAVSGSGRSLENLLKHQEFEVACVVSNKENCRAVSIAKAKKIKTVIIDKFNADNAAELNQRLLDLQVRLIVLAGFLIKFPVLEAFTSKIINIHPALLPKYGGRGFYGMTVHAAVIKAGDAWSGATVHLVNGEYDQGRILEQAKVKVDTEDDAMSLAKKVFEQECLLLPKVIKEQLG